METGHDKEIDALLRDRGLRTITTAERSLAGDHLDADALAGFAENALPANARVLYMKHLADCGDCRSVLSGLIALNADAATEEVSAAAPVKAAAATEVSIPWYRRLFAGPSLAYTMGGLLLVFGGLIGFTVLQNMQGDSVASIKGEDTANTTAARGPMESELMEPSAELPSAANAAASSANAAANAAPYATPLSQTASNAAASPKEKSEEYIQDGVVMAKPISPPAPPPAAAPADDEAVSEAAKKRIDELATRQTQTTPIAGETANPPAGPDRGLQRENRSMRGVPAARPTPIPERQMSARDREGKRTLSGKTFEQRDSVWYDSAYKGQATTNVRRGTENYRKLDSGLRSITDRLDGTVVIVWKEKAYRID